ncbi:MAG: ATP-dependent helicase [Phycisphaerales bacterium]|nr:ATP-dependent helicase [Phycisphaerales bacterium]
MHEVDTLLEGLNDAQRRAAEFTGRPLIVLAGPGTGKTRVIIARVARLLRDGADPESILAVTFTVKAAEEMRSRLADCVGGPKSERVNVSTFHSFGSRVLRRFGDYLGLPAQVSVMDSARQRRLLLRLIEQHDLLRSWKAAGRDGAISRAIRFISDARNAGRSAAEAARYARDWLRSIGKQEEGPTTEGSPEADALAAGRVRAEEFAEFAEVFGHFEAASLEGGDLTLDDFLTLPVRLLTEQSGVAPVLRSEFRHIVVDEFQDANPAQIALLRALAPPRSGGGGGPDLCVVGDDDQSIYGFRGADTRAFRRFAQIWPEHEEILLETNYRSAPAIIEAGNTIIARAAERFRPDKVIRPGRDDLPGTIEGVLVADDTGELPDAAAALIVADRAAHPTRKWHDYLVLCRTRLDADRAGAALELRGVPIDLKRPVTPLNDQGVQDVMAWVGLVLGEDEALHAQRLLTRPPMGVDLAQVGAWVTAFRRQALYAGTADGDPSTDEAGRGRGFVGWLAEQHRDHPAVDRLTTVLQELRPLAVELRASEMMMEIIRRTGVAHGGTGGREAARRVERLAAVVRFVRAKDPHLDEPGDLRAWQRYYADLDSKEQEFDLERAETAERLGENGDQASGAGDEQDAVRVLTVHKAKGLEADTVLVLRVRPGAQHGFPITGRSDEEGSPLPADFRGVADEEQIEEERRLFYVACTRAKRRLVLLAKARKGQSRSTDFFDELRGSVHVAVGDGARLLEEAGAGVAVLDGDHDRSTPEARRRLIAERFRTAVRGEADAALLDAERGQPGAAARAGERLGSAARLLAAAAALAGGREPSDDIMLNVGERERIGRLRSALASTDAGPGLFAPLTGPLRLSYSMIDAYRRCPRCCYMRFVLGLAQPAKPELAVGNALHVAAKAYLERERAADSDGDPAKAPNESDLLRWGDEALRDLWVGRVDGLPEARRKLEAQLRVWRNAFHDDAEIMHVEHKVTFRYASEECGTHSFEAKPDRVDRLRDGRYRIVDYKTGEGWKTLLEPEPDNLQMCIYAMALPTLLALTDDDGRPVEPPGVDGVAEFWVMGEGRRGVLEFSEMRLDKARKQIDEAIAGMLAGRWAKKPDSHRGCDWLPEA